MQPNAVSKSIFVRPDADGGYRTDSDAWYFRATITDVPASSSVAFVGAASDMSRIRWQIDEKYLYAYKDDPDLLGTTETHGGIVAAFPILSHFDIRRAYNAATGEESNLLEENSVDRPWYQREYMRVDWSTNQISEKEFTFPGIESFSAATYYVQDSKDKDFPIFQDDYVDVTAKYAMQPSTLSCFYLYRQQVGFEQACGPVQISMRVSFMKVPQREFVPREYPDRVTLTDDKGDTIRTVGGTPVTMPAMDQFGYFRTERAVYDPRYGSLEKRYLYRANTWNLWKEWFKKDEGGKVQYETGKDGKPDTSRPVMLPYADRKIRPVVYFLNAEWPEELKDTAKDVANGWDDAFKETVASLRALEKKGKGGTLTAAELAAEKAKLTEPIFVLCPNNPVKASDPEACGPAGTVARVGDQRYSFLYWVPQFQMSGPLGFGPSYADPVTGEIFSAAAYIYGGALDHYSQWALEVVNLLVGKYKGYDYINGVNTDLYVKRLKDGDVPGPSAPSGTSASVPGDKSFDLDALKGQVDKAIDRPQLAAVAGKGLPLAVGASGDARLASVAATPIGRRLLDIPEFRILAGKDPDQSLSDDELKLVADRVLGGAHAAEEMRLKYLGTHGCYYAAEFADDATVGLARELAAAYPSGGTPAEEEKAQYDIWMVIRKRVLQAVSEHEVGHTLGLRHNFEGTSDALNFHDDYWDLRGAAPKYGEAMTEDQKSKKMVEYEYSTVMDYGSRFNSDIHGLGKYDRAAIRFGYGNLVEAWPSGKVVDPLYKADPAKLPKGLTGYSAEVLDAVNRGYRHYTTIPKQFSDGLASVKTAGREIRRYEDVLASARELYLAAGTRVDSVKTGTSAKTDATKAIDVVPYRYCGDEYAGNAGRPLCERWDRGADSFEVARDAMDRFRTYYVFDAFSRGRTSGFNMLINYQPKIYSRYFGRVHQQYSNWLYYQGQRVEAWKTLDADGNGVKNGYITDPDWFKDPNGGLPGTVATYWGLDRLTEVLAHPEVGTYVEYSSRPGYLSRAGSPWACGSGGNPVRCGSSATQAVLDIEDGARFPYTQYDGSLGSSYYLRIKSVGSFYDRVEALRTVTRSDATFLGVDKTNDLQYRTSYFMAYPKAMTAVLGGIASDARDNFSWRYDGVDTVKKTIKLQQPEVFANAGTGEGLPPPSSLKGKPIDAQWYLTYKGIALLFGMSRLQSTYSQSFNDAVHVWCAGCGEGFTPGPGVKTVSFTDPLSGKTYTAVDPGDGRFSPAAQLVKTGQDWVTAYETASDPDTRDNAIANLAYHIEFIDLARSLYQQFGKSGF